MLNALIFTVALLLTISTLIRIMVAVGLYIKSGAGFNLSVSIILVAISWGLFYYVTH